MVGHVSAALDVVEVESPLGEGNFALEEVVSAALLAVSKPLSRDHAGLARGGASSTGRGRMDVTLARARIDMLRVEHRDLDDAIAALLQSTVPDQLQIARLKKRKLRLRDELAELEDRLIPDIIA